MSHVPRARLRGKSSASLPRRTSTARSSRRTISAAPSFAARRCCSSTSGETGARPRAGVDGTRSTATSRPAAPRPRRIRCVRRARTARRKAAGGSVGFPPTCARSTSTRRSPAARTRNGPNQYPGEVHSALRHERTRRRGPPAYTAMGKQVRDWLFVEDHCGGPSSSCCARGAGRRDLQRRRRRRAREHRGRRAHPGAHRLPTARFCAVSPTVWATIAATRSTRRSSMRSAGRRRCPSKRACGRRWSGIAQERDWWQPIKSGEYREYYARQYADRLANAHRRIGGKRPSAAKKPCYRGFPFPGVGRG